jgi:rhamnose transport system permease protein
VLTAVVLGGVSIKGGTGRVVGVLLSLILLATLQTGMQLANVPGTSQSLVIGCLLVVSLGVPRAIALFRGRRRTPALVRPDPPNGPDDPTPVVLEKQRG